MDSASSFGACRPQDLRLNILARLLGRRGAPRKPANIDDASVFDARAVVDTIDRALSSAGLDRHSGSGTGIRATIDQALAQAGLRPTQAPAPDFVRARVVPSGDAHELPAPARPDASPAAGDFVQRSYANAAGSREYKLYVPHGYGADAPPMPLLVMLHGCTQSPDDFAAGTRMNALADAHGFLVVYPEQAARANGSKCWNWFRAEDQQHGRGEPSLLAGITQQVAMDYRVDPRRIFVAGLSAGAAMAVILGHTHPEVFAAVGAHSGLPYRAAHDMASAFAAMQGRTAGIAGAGVAPTPSPVPTIVFHGDGDHTVVPANSRAIVATMTAGLQPATQQGAVPGGRRYTRDVFVDGEGRPRVEQWTVHGAGHAWSGGSAQGTYTDPAGPDASAEMIRFFQQQRPAAR